MKKAAETNRKAQKERLVKNTMGSVLDDIKRMGEEREKRRLQEMETKTSMETGEIDFDD